MGKNREFIDGLRDMAVEAEIRGEKQIIVWLSIEGARWVANVIEAAEEEEAN